MGRAGRAQPGRAPRKFQRGCARMKLAEITRGKRGASRVRGISPTERPRASPRSQSQCSCAQLAWPAVVHEKCSQAPASSGFWYCSAGTHREVSGLRSCLGAGGSEGGFCVCGACCVSPQARLLRAARGERPDLRLGESERARKRASKRASKRESESESESESERAVEQRFSPIGDGRRSTRF